MTRNDAQQSRSDPADADGPALRADVTVQEQGPDECLVYPEEPLDGNHTAAWIAAEGDAFVSLPDAR